MLMLEYVKWWYGTGWAGSVKNAERRMTTLSDMFSVAILLRTLFSPWKRIISYPGAGLEAHLRAFVDNLVSRVIGFFVRIGVLIAAAVTFVLIGVFSFALITLWPLIPLAAVGLIVWGLL